MTVTAPQKTARIEDAPGCMGSPTIRAVETEICKACGFRLMCAELAQVNRKHMEEMFGPLKFPSVYIQRPKISTPQTVSGPTGEKLSLKAEAMRKDLRAYDYTQSKIKKVIETGEEPEDYKGSKKYPWLIPLLKAIHKGVDEKEGLRDVIIANSPLTGMVAAANARLFLSILLHWGIVQRRDGMIIKGDDNA